METVLLTTVKIKTDVSISIVFSGFYWKKALQSKFDKQLHFSI